jgi:S1-C subfamily serine protease
MIATHTAGTFRLMTTGTVAALTLIAQGAHAQGAVGGAQPARVMIAATKDTAGRVNQRVVLITPVIDSLVKRLNGLPIGSAEFAATNAALQAAFRDMPLPPGGTYEISVTAPRSAVRTPVDVVPRGTLGFTADGFNRRFYSSTGDYLQYFEYPTVVAIEANSPASRAGVRAGDLVVAYNGDDVRANWINMTQLLTPGRDITVKLRRDGDMRDVLMTVEKAPERLMADRRASVAMEDKRVVEVQAMAASRARTPPSVIARTPVAVGAAGGSYGEVRAATATMAPAMNGVLGAAMTDVDADLARVVRGMEGKRGVLVTRVPTGSLADRTGLRGGDVILRVDASDVATVAQFRVRMMLAEQSGQDKVKLTILRDEKTQEITYFVR